MSRRLAVLIGMLMSASLVGSVSAQDGPPSLHYDFEGRGDAGLTGWRMAPGAADAGYAFLPSAMNPHAGEGAAQLSNPADEANAPNTAAAVWASIPAEAYRGRRVRFRAFVRTQGQDSGLSGLWLRVDRPDRQRGFFDNMADRPVRSSDWTPVEIVAPVAVDATNIIFGLMRMGSGSIWIDDASLELASDPDEPAQPLSAAASAYLHEALDVLKRHHINGAAANWQVVAEEASRRAQGAQTLAQTYDAIRGAIATLGETHTRFVPPTTPEGSRSADSTPPVIAVFGQVHMIRLPGLTTVGRSPQAGEDYQAVLHAAVSETNGRQACGWIVDLRENGGGNMWPMLNGIEGLLGPGPYGAFVTPEGLRYWNRNGRGVISVDQGPAQSGTGRQAAMGPALQPVAVLLGPDTASSGEMVAIAFKGREHTRSFGRPTAGYTTANLPVRLSDGAFILVTTAKVADRSGRTVVGPVVPDEAGSDADLQVPLRDWFKQEGCDLPVEVDF